MKYKEYFIANSEGKSNCVIRTFCKLFNKEYDEIYNELCNIQKNLNSETFNDIEVFEELMNKNGINEIDHKETKVKELLLDNGTYVIFCWDKKDYYHMIPIIDNTIYDKNDKCLDLYTIKIYKKH